MCPRGAGEEGGGVQDDQDLGVCESLAVFPGGGSLEGGSLVK